MVGIDSCIDYIKRYGYDRNGGDIYQFGVYVGTSLKKIQDCLNEYGVIYGRLRGFDSFQGLPEERKGIPRDEMWYKGQFDMTVDGSTPFQVAEKILKELDLEADLHVGFYDKLELHKEMLPALFIDIDCDLYVSTMQALSFMAENKLIRPHTIIRYDDWGGTEEYKGGESLAHKRICKKYGIYTKEIMTPLNLPPHVVKVFEVINVR